MVSIERHTAFLSASTGLGIPTPTANEAQARQIAVEHVMQAIADHRSRGNTKRVEAHMVLDSLSNYKAAAKQICFYRRFWYVCLGHEVERM